MPPRACQNPSVGRHDAALEGFSAREETYLGRTRTVYRRGEGPPVLVMAEVPGLTPRVLAFARRVCDRGLSVACPDMFGVPGQPPSPLQMGRVMARACISREFALLARHRASPITQWLRALARALHEDSGSPVGAVGMCLTGNFALTLCLDPWMIAPVLSQPSLPTGLGAAKRALHATPEACQTLARRAKDDGLHVIGLRFTGDPLCPRERFDALGDLLGDAFEGIEIDSSSGNPHGHRRMAHSVLTEDLIDEEGQPTQRALERVLDFLESRLRPAS